MASWARMPPAPDHRFIDAGRWPHSTTLVEQQPIRLTVPSSPTSPRRGGSLLEECDAELQAKIHAEIELLRAEQRGATDASDQSIYDGGRSGGRASPGSSLHTPRAATVADEALISPSGVPSVGSTIGGRAPFRRQGNDLAVSPSATDPAHGPSSARASLKTSSVRFVGLSSATTTPRRMGAAPSAAQHSGCGPHMFDSLPIMLPHKLDVCRPPPRTAASPTSCRMRHVRTPFTQTTQPPRARSPVAASCLYPAATLSTALLRRTHPRHSTNRMHATRARTSVAPYNPPETARSLPTVTSVVRAVMDATGVLTYRSQWVQLAYDRSPMARKLREEASVASARRHLSPARRHDPPRPPERLPSSPVKWCAPRSGIDDETDEKLHALHAIRSPRSPTSPRSPRSPQGSRWGSPPASPRDKSKPSPNAVTAWGASSTRSLHRRNAMPPLAAASQAKAAAAPSAKLFAASEMGIKPPVVHLLDLPYVSPRTRTSASAHHAAPGASAGASPSRVGSSAVLPGALRARSEAYLEEQRRRLGLHGAHIAHPNAPAAHV